MNACKLSIVLPVFEDQKNLNRIISELLANQPDDSWEVIVVDDGSSPSLELAPNIPQYWQLVRNAKRQGAAVSRNKGAAAAQSDHLIFLSVFLKIPPDYLTRVKRFIQNGEFDFAQHLLKKAPEIKITKFQTFLLDQKDRLDHKNQALPVKQSLFTAAIIKTDVFRSVGGFDETMNHYGGHELDLIYRLDCAGYKKRILIGGFPLERIKSEDQDKIRERLVEYGRVGLPHLLEKHPDLEKTILFKPLLWSLVYGLGLTHWLESWLRQKIEADVNVPVAAYRLYLHLIVRNAWADR